MIYFNKNALRNKLQHYKQRVLDLLRAKERRENDKKVDEASWESMDASDPPARGSNRSDDKVLH